VTTSPGDRGTSRRDPETGGRPLADILREAGVESPARGRRRREDDTDTGVRQRGSGGERPADTGRVGERAPFGRRAVDRTGDLARPTPTPDRRRARPEPSTAAIPGLRPSQKPGVPGAATSATGSLRAQKPADAGPSTGPIPVVRSDDDAPLLEDEALGPREGALAWLRFAGELVIALAAGVAVYFAATVLWEMVPHLAVLLTPLAVTGLVAGVGMWRQRQGREPMGPRLMAVLVFAGTVLTIAPAAGLLSGG
jgi:hypothetical protein